MQGKRRNWAFEDLEKAVGEVQEGSLSVREAATKYNVPKNTIHDHACLKVKQGSRPGPAPVLTEDEGYTCLIWDGTLGSCATYLYLVDYQ